MEWVWGEVMYKRIRGKIFLSVGTFIFLSGYMDAVRADSIIYNPLNPHEQVTPVDEQSTPEEPAQAPAPASSEDAPAPKKEKPKPKADQKQPEHKKRKKHDQRSLFERSVLEVPIPHSFDLDGDGGYGYEQTATGTRMRVLSGVFMIRS